MSVRDWFFVPTSVEYALPWVAGPLLSLVLSALAPVPRSDECATPRTLFTLLFAAIVVAALNALLLWAHIRVQFATWRLAIKPMTGTYLLLSAACVAVGGAALWLRGRAQFAPRDADVVFTGEVVLTALSSLGVALAVSSFWKTEEPGLADIRMERNVALRLLAKLPSNISANQYRALVDTVKAITGSANTVQVKLSRDADRELVASWAEAASELYAILYKKTVHDYVELQRDLQPEVDAQVAILSKGSR